MKLSDHSKNRLLHSFDKWAVEAEYSQHIYDYLVHGWHPGSFYTAVLANDFVSAMVLSHPANSILTLKNLASWIINAMPADARGSYDHVGLWLKTGPERRREILERCNLIYTTKEEMWLILKHDHTSNLFLETNV